MDPFNLGQTQRPGMRQNRSQDIQVDSLSEEEPGELDADNSVERAFLSPASGQWDLAFFPESSNGHYWRIVETEISEREVVTRREVIRYLDLEKNTVLPLSTLQPSRGNERNVVIIYDKEQREYPLLNQEQASKFQKVITGYRTSQIYDSVSCGVIYKGRGISSLVRNKEDGGIGEVQLWEWPKTPKVRNQPWPPLIRSTPTSRNAASISSTVQTLPRTSMGTFFQTTSEGELLVSSIPPPPVLALFIHDQGSYKMMKADSRSFKQNHWWI